MSTTTALDNTNSPLNLLIGNLINVPHLQRLTLRSTTMGLTDIERLHSNAPNLTYLKISYLTLVQEDNTIDFRSIMPSQVQILKISFDNADAPSPTYINGISGWLAYIGKEYNSLMDIKLTTVSYDRELENHNKSST